MTDWPALPVRRMFAVVNGGTPTAEDANWGGDVQWATPVDLAQVNGGVLTATERTLTEEGLRNGSRAVPSGSLVLSTRAPIGYVAESSVQTAFNQGCRGLVPVVPLVLRYFRYQLWSLADRLEAWGQGSTFVELSGDALAAFPLVVPPAVAQLAIAEYLDRETGRIEALLVTKRRMVALLDERRHSARETLVAEGWRDVPGTRLGYLMREIDERLGSSDPPPLLSVSIHHGVIPFVEANPDRVPRADDLGNYKRCEPNDIILNRMRAFQGGVGRATVAGIVSPDYAVLRPSSDASPAYLNHLLRSPWFVGQMEKLLRGIGGVEQGNVRTPRVNWDDLRTVIVPFPSFGTQVRLAEQLDLQLSHSWRTQRVIERQIATIQERRRALIAAAITGQIDIPEAA